VDDDAGVLEIDTLGEQVGCEQQSESFARRRLLLTLCTRSETREQLPARHPSAGDPRVGGGEPDTPGWRARVVPNDFEIDRASATAGRDSPAGRSS